VVRILIEKDLPLNLMPLINKAFEALSDKFEAGSVADDVSDYIFDRLRAYYQEQGIGFDIVDAVISTKPEILNDCDQRVQAVNQFQKNDAALALAAANKRIANILKKQGVDKGLTKGSVTINERLFEATAEKQLFQQLVGLQGKVDSLFVEGEYLQGLNELASLRPVVDQFFDEVMVMVEDPAVKANRLALLSRLLSCFRQVADFSKIQS
jgi:glycyl-tRNA synthetase beta chain